MFQKCFVVFLTCFVTTRSQITSAPPSSTETSVTTLSSLQGNEETTTIRNSQPKCSETPGYRDLNGVGSITFHAGILNTSATMLCLNCEISGLPESVICVNTNDSTDASMPAWTCSADFPQSRSYKINSTSLNCESYGDLPNCVKIESCRLRFSVKKVISNTGELTVVAFVVLIVFVLLLIEIRRSMRRERALFASRILWLQDFSHSEAFVDGRKPNFPSTGAPDMHLAIAMSTSARFSTIASYSSLDITPSSREQVL